MSDYNRFKHPDCVVLSKKYAPDDYTNVTEDVCQCNNCGAYADTMENVVHHLTCKPGESKKWEDHYNTPETEKVLIHDESPTEVHLVGEPFISATHTLCGKRLHSICSVHIIHDDIPVTCKECKEVHHE